MSEVLIDTSVWIDFFGGRALSHVSELTRLIEEDENLCTTGVILTELFQGIRSDTQYRKTEEYFGALIYLPMTEAIFVSAAALYRMLRKKRVTIRQPVDCMIASVAIDYAIPLLQNDRDFDQIAKHSKLRIWKPRTRVAR